MRHRILIATLFTLISGALMPAAEPPAIDNELWFFIQQDTQQAMARLQFQEGFEKLLAGLPAGTPVRVILFRGTDYNVLWSGAAETAPRPMPGLVFGVANAATTPYKNLLRLLRTESVKNRTIVFISNGVSQDMLILKDDSGFFRMEANSFTPNRYPPLDQVVRYCRDNEIRLLGFFVGLNPPARGDLSDISFSMFRYVVEEAKGKSFYNYNSFPGVFDTVLKQGLLTGPWKH